MHYTRLISSLKARREMLQVTQAQLAELAGVSKRALASFESGKGNPTLATLIKLADALGLEIGFQVKQSDTAQKNS